MRHGLRFTTIALTMFAWVPASEAACKNSGRFGDWLADFRAEAAAKGISNRTIRSALGDVTYDPKVISRDRRQGVFAQSFLKFSARMANKNRLAHGLKRIKKYRKTFQQVEKRYGVPAPIIAAFWGLETDYGANIGNMKTLRSLATLAYDCRRPELFRDHLFDALRIIERGDLTASQMIGAWAGELGQTQFLPSDYMESAVDFDGDGRRDLLRSVPDVLASTANVLKKMGWKAGRPWLQEVRVPARLAWDQADLTIVHPRSQWVKWGVKGVGRQLKSDAMEASLLLPMGRNGPAFLAYENFRVYLDWNHSLVYSTTAAYFATRLAGAPRISRGRKEVTPLSVEQVKRMQNLLIRKGFDVGGADGVVGAKTRDAIKKMQIKYGLPADSYPSADLLRRLSAG